MPTGIVQYYLKEKGYGYIRVPETNEEFYVNSRQVEEPLQKGDRVQFDIKENKQGLYASDVKKMKDQY